jgi:hypothetical protein
MDTIVKDSILSERIKPLAIEAFLIHLPCTTPRMYPQKLKNILLFKS